MRWEEPLGMAKDSNGSSHSHLRGGGEGGDGVTNLASHPAASEGSPIPRRWTVVGDPPQLREMISPREGDMLVGSLRCCVSASNHALFVCSVFAF